MICKEITNCEEDFNQSKKALKDKKGGKSKYIIHNKSNSNYSIIDFENCVYKNKKNDTKCDFGLKTTESIFYIELKGSDVVNGIKQLLITANETERCFDSLHKKARLVVSKFSKPEIAYRTKEYKNLVKKIGSVNNFEIKQNQYTEII